MDPSSQEMPSRTEQTFRAIESGPFAPDQSKLLKNLRIDKPKLKKYLSQFYNQKIAQKLVSLFDIPQPSLDVHAFYKTFFCQIVGIEKQPKELFEHARSIVFLMLDQNQDSHLDQDDLFKFMQEVKNETTMRQAAYRDI